MLSKPALKLLRASIAARPSPIVACAARQFSSTKPPQAKNRVYTPVRREDDFTTYLQLSTSSRIPLITLWTASYCSTCKHISPLLLSLLESGVGEAEGGVAYCEVEYDSMDIMDSGLGMRYMITSMPTLLAFDRGEAQMGTKVVDPKLMGNREMLGEWIRNEARRRGDGGDGGGGGGLLGGLFGLKL